MLFTTEVFLSLKVDAVACLSKNDQCLDPQPRQLYPNDWFHSTGSLTIAITHSDRLYGCSVWLL